MTAEPSQTPATRIWVFRHPLAVRLTHWVNLLCVVLLLASGLQIFNAHPALYWGQASTFDSPFLSMSAREVDGRSIGEVTILGAKFETTGVLGLSRSGGRLYERGFPAWATLPSWQDLATGRRWHFFFAWLFLVNGLSYLTYLIFSRRLTREIAPSRADIKALGRTIRDHLRLRLPRGEEARHYNPLQRVAYLIVVIALLPLLFLAGLAMSPGMDAAFPWLVDIFGGRQSARSVHFLAAFLLVLFALAHVLMILLVGVLNPIRSMITGRYRIEIEEKRP